MFKISFITLSSILNALSVIVDENMVDNRRKNEIKNMSIFFTSQRFIGVEYLIFSTKKTLNLL